MTDAKDRRIAQLEQENADLQQENADLQQENADLQQENADLQRKIAGQTLTALRKSPVSYADRTCSTPHIPKTTHNPAETVVTVLELPDLPEAVWDAPYTRPLVVREKSIDSEAMVVAEACNIIQAVLRGLGIAEVVTISTNRTIAGVECDIVLLYGSQRIPFAVIEVKKPGTNNFDRIIFSSKGDEGIVDAGVVAGQNFDQLCVLELMGYKSVFGMITNGNKWMITTKRSTELKVPVESGYWDKLVAEIQSYAETEKDHSPEQEQLVFEPSTQSSSFDVERCLNVSQIVESLHGEEFIKLIAVFIRLACQTIGEAKARPELSNVSCRVLNLHAQESGKDCRSLRCSFQKHSWNSINLSSTVKFSGEQEIYLFYHLGGGQNGDCCLALTKTGKQSCVVKFYLKTESGTSRRELARAEFDNWKKVYSEMNCWVGELPDEDGYLCMPYLEPIPSVERNKLLDSGQIKEALERFVKSGYKHTEVLWRHIGRYQGKLYLLDLGGIEEYGTEECRDRWISDSLEELRCRATTTPLSTPCNGSTAAIQVQATFDHLQEDESGRLPILSSEHCQKKRRVS